jgi:hypothetical protein
LCGSIIPGRRRRLFFLQPGRLEPGLLRNNIIAPQFGHLKKPALLPTVCRIRLFTF